jgi:hypothetical protein
MILHRGHFLQAVRNSPLDPARGPYGVSFRTAVYSAWEILDWMPTFFEANPAKAVYVHPHSWTWVMTAVVRVFKLQYFDASYVLRPPLDVDVHDC